jgi:hypothetical protein
MSAPPQGLTLKHDRDFVGLERKPRTRRVLLALLGLFVALGLLNVFGQRPSTSTVSGAAAELELYAPKRVRSGLYFEARFRIDAERRFGNATLVLDPGWLEGMTLNTVTPSPVDEGSRDGRIAFELGPIPADDTYLLFLQFQANPTNVGHRSADVDLYDGDELVAHIDRTITVFP